MPTNAVKAYIKRRQDTLRYNHTAAIPWEIRIKLAEEHGGFSSTDSNLASSWVTCACGEQDPTIPRHLGAPEDGELSRLGMAFMDAVESDDYQRARDLLVVINHRAVLVMQAVKRAKKTRTKTKVKR